MALRVDVHYPPILDRGDTVCCFPNLEPGAISRFRNALNAMLEANERTRAANGKEYIQTVFVMFGHGSFPKKENVTFTLVFF